MSGLATEEKKYFVVCRVKGEWVLYWPEPATHPEAENYQHGANVGYGRDATRIVSQEELRQYLF